MTISSTLNFHHNNLISALQALTSFSGKTLMSPTETVALAETVKVEQIKMPKGVGKKV